MEYLIFGDCHGCLDELKELLVKCGCQIENNKIKSKFQIISLGDYLDKGPKVRETIDFFYENDIVVVQANHEYWNIGYWDGKWDVEQQIKDQSFTSHNLEESYREKVRQIYNKSVPYFVGPNFIATHSPCHCKYLCKDDSISLKMQRNFRYTYLTEEEIVKWLSELPSNKCWPYHVFGHIALDTIYTRDNLIGLDTGCASGNYLSAVKLVEGHKPYFIKVKSRQPEDKVIKVRAERVYSIEEQEPRLRKKVQSIIDNGINFISGTMCPANNIGDDLESIQWALNYYKENGCQIVVIQKKEMGNRAQIYLFSDPDKCYVVTRNGFRKDIPELKPEYNRLIERFKDKFANGLQLRIIDAELMPWRTLGESLIDKSFYGFWEMAYQEESLCRDLGFDQVINSISGNLNPDFNNLPKKEFIDKYKHHVYSFNKSGRELLKMNLKTEDHLRGLDTFKKQCDLYGQSGIPYFIPFAILKDVYPDKEVLYYDQSNYEMYCELSDREVWMVGVDDLKSATKIFSALTKDGIEGIVIKPDFNMEGVAPYLKVRNPNYLHIIYGYDYQDPTKYQKLLDRKRIGRKLKASIYEYELGWQMLSQPYNNLDNPKFTSTLIEFFNENVEGIDPRL